MASSRKSTHLLALLVAMTMASSLCFGLVKPVIRATTLFGSDVGEQQHVVFEAVPDMRSDRETGASMVGVLFLLAAGARSLSARRGAALQGSRQPSQAVARQAAKAPLVVIAGPPAAGKGTQCEKIKEKFGYVHISTGDILRANVKEGTELGKKAEEYMTAGKLVPSELIVDLVKDRLAKPDVLEKGCLLDGFPRAPDQAKAMSDAGIEVDKFILIEVPDDVLVERGCGRRLDPETGEIYHLKFKPPPAEVVDRLVHRSDDQEESIRNRLAIYHDQVNGILPFFESAVCKIDGLPKPAEVTEKVFAVLG